MTNAAWSSIHFNLLLFISDATRWQMLLACDVSFQERQVLAEPQARADCGLPAYMAISSSSVSILRGSSGKSLLKMQTAVHARWP